MSAWFGWILLAEQAASATGQGSSLPLSLAITIFVLAVFVGFEIITKVPPTLHTPLMSGSNAISGITVVGAILAAGAGHSIVATVLGTLAVALATINVVGGFLVTDRMLHMFRRKSK
ncbi:MAG: NAD(P) transhydrogenase subunit alpha [Thermogutta sp.]